MIEGYNIERQIKKNIIQNDDMIKIYCPQRKVKNKSCKNLNYQNKDDNIETGKRMNEDNNIKISSNNENLLTAKFDRKRIHRRKSSHILQIANNTNNIFSF